MAPTRSKPLPERSEIASTAADKVQAGELKGIVEEILRDRIEQQQQSEINRNARLQELFGMVLVAGSGPGKISEGLIAFEDEILRDEQGWKRYMTDHAVTSGKSAKKLSLPKLKPVPFDIDPVYEPSEPLPGQSDPPVDDDGDTSMTIEEREPTGKAVDSVPPDELSTAVPATINPSLLLSTSTFAPVPLDSLPFKPQPRVYKPTLFTNPSNAPLSGQKVEHHPYLYPPAASGSVYRIPGPATPPGEAPLELVEEGLDAPTPEEISYHPMTLEGEYARTLHPLPELPSHRSRSTTIGGVKRQRTSASGSRQVSGSGLGHGPHMSTSVQLSASAPGGGVRDRSASPDGLGAGFTTGPSGERAEKGKMDLYRLGLGFKENPVSAMVGRGWKCMGTREWKTAWQEVKFLRTLERIEHLKQQEKWSFRQPKKFRGPVIPKSHWDFLLDEMRWMQADFKEERKWKIAAASELGRECRRFVKGGESRKAKMSVGGRKWGQGGTEGKDMGKGKGRMDPELEDDGMELDEQLPDPEEGISPAVDEVIQENQMLIDEEGIEEAEVTDQEVSATLKGKEREREKLEADRTAAEDDEDEDADGEAEDEEGEDAEGEAEDADGEAETEDIVELEESAPQLGDISVEVDAEEAIQARALQPGSNSYQTLGVHAPEAVALPPRSFASLTKELRQPLLSASPSKYIFNLPELLDGSTPADAIPSDMGLQELFPDLAIYSGLAVPTEGKIEKRTDESMQGAGRLTHTTRLMDLRPVLVSTLQPGKNRTLSGTWEMDEAAWEEEGDWGSMSAQQPPPAIFAPKNSARRPHNRDLVEHRDPAKPRHADARAATLEWEEAEDNLLRELAEDYLLNWELISDIFNSSRVTISTDSRSPWDCFHRWNSRWGPGSLESAVSASAAGDPSSATGTEAQNAVAGPGPSTAAAAAMVPEPSSAISLTGDGGGQGPPSPNTMKRDAKAAKLTKFEGSKKKVRNTCLKDAMRRIQKRRDLSKKPRDPRGMATVLNVHESHNQYLTNRIAPTPQELSHAQHEQVVMQQEQMRMEHHRRNQMRLLQSQQQQAGRMQQMQMQQAQAQQANALQQQQQQQQPQIQGQQQIAQGQQMAPRLQQNGIPMQGVPNQPLQGTPVQMPVGLPNQVNVAQGPPRPLTAQGGHMQQQQQLAQQQLTQAMMAQAQQQGRPIQNMPVGNRMPMQVINGQVVNGQAQARPMNMQGGQMNQAQLNQAALQAQGMAQALQGGGGMQQQPRNVSSPASSQAGLQGSPQLQSGQVVARPSSAASQSRPNGSSASPQLNNRPPSSQGGANPNMNNQLLASMLGRMGNSNGPFQIGGQTIPPEQFRAIQLQLMQQMQQQQQQASGGQPVGSQINPQVNISRPYPAPIAEKLTELSNQMILQQQLQAQQHAAQQQQMQAHIQQGGNMQNQVQQGNGQ